MQDIDINAEETLDEELAAEMVKAGVLYSHKKSKADPRMRPFISANRHEIDVLDMQAVLESIENASTFLKETLSKGGLVLFVGTAPSVSKAVKDIADKFNQPYVTHRWLGGTLTNFDVIRKRIDYYIGLKEKQTKGEFEKYTKKEQVKFSDEIAKLSQRFEGLVKLECLPDAIFVVDAGAHTAVVKEANSIGIPVAAVIDSDDNPELITHPLIANDHAKSSVEWVINRVNKKLRTVQKKSVRKEKEKEEV